MLADRALVCNTRRQKREPVLSRIDFVGVNLRRFAPATNLVNASRSLICESLTGLMRENCNEEGNGREQKPILEKHFRSVLGVLMIPKRLTKYKIEIAWCKTLK
jgi:hypothetical protein